DGVPAFDGEIFDQGRVLNARVVHEDVDAAQHFDCFLYELPGVFTLGEISMQIMCSYTEFAFNRRAGALDFGCIAEAVDHDVCAVTRQLPGDGQANTTGGTRDYRFLAFEHVASFHV